MVYQRFCGFYYRLCLLCMLLLIALQFESFTQWFVFKDTMLLRRPYSEIFKPPQLSMNKSPETYLQDIVDKFGSLIHHFNDDEVNSFPEEYADYELETADDSVLNDIETADGSELNDTLDDDLAVMEDIDIQPGNKEFNTTLMVLFTSWGYSKEKLAVHETLLRLWSSWLKLGVLPLVLTNEAKVRHMAFASNWSVLPVTKRLWYCKGPPVLRNLFLDTMHAYEALFYGYANADIIFGNGLVQTLKYLRNKYQWSESPVLIVGRRYNYDFKKNRVKINDSSDVKGLQKYGNLVIRSTDYFFTNKPFPWKQVPMVSIGRPFVVRAVIAFAIKHRYDIIDATRTIESVHLTTADGNLASWHKPGVGCNKHILFKGHYQLPLRKGHCECARLETVYDEKGDIRLRHRKASPSLCKNHF